MIAIAQVVKKAYIQIQNIKFSEIKNGILLYIGICLNDTKHDVEYIANKFLNLKIWPKENGKFGLPVKHVNPPLLIVSEFTLCADVRHGSHIGFNTAMPGTQALELYEQLIEKLTPHIDIIRTGKFGADMQVFSINNGPITFVLNSKGYNY